MAEKAPARQAIRRMLWKWGNTLQTINRLEHEREAFRAWADDARETVRAQAYRETPGGGRKGDLSDAIDRIVERQKSYETQVQRIDAEIVDAIRFKNEIDALVAELSPAQIRVIEYRYIDGHTWQFIAMKTNYNEGHVRRLEANALDKLSEHIQIS